MPIYFVMETKNSPRPWAQNPRYPQCVSAREFWQDTFKGALQKQFDGFFSISSLKSYTIMSQSYTHRSDKHQTDLNTKQNTENSRRRLWDVLWTAWNSYSSKIRCPQVSQTRQTQNISLGDLFRWFFLLCNMYGTHLCSDLRFVEKFTQPDISGEILHTKSA